jgi:hypothetical protein
MVSDSYIRFPLSRRKKHTEIVHTTTSAIYTMSARVKSYSVSLSWLPERQTTNSTKPVSWAFWWVVTNTRCLFSQSNGVQTPTWSWWGWLQIHFNLMDRPLHALQFLQFKSGYQKDTSRNDIYGVVVKGVSVTFTISWYCLAITSKCGSTPWYSRSRETWHGDHKSNLTVRRLEVDTIVSSSEIKWVLQDSILYLPKHAVFFDKGRAPASASIDAYGFLLLY